jgi:hypothetical protein
MSGLFNNWINRSLILIVAPALLSSSSKAALLEGHRIQAQFHYKSTPLDSGTGVSENAIVGPGVEFEDFGFRAEDPALPALVDVDISDRSILVTLIIDQPAAAQQSFVFIDDDMMIPIFHNVLFNPASNWSGVSSQSIIFSSEAITINTGGRSGLQGQFVLLDIVPEPAAAGLLISAIAAMALGARRPASARSVPPRRLLARLGRLVGRP